MLTAVRDYDPNLVVIVGGAETPAIAKELGVRVLPEAYCDLDYHPNGYPVVERQKRAWDPEEVARRALRIALEQRGTAVDGTELKLDMRTFASTATPPTRSRSPPSSVSDWRRPESRSCRCGR